MPCDELTSEDYDLYVLGTLEDPALEALQAHLHRECVACVGGVARARQFWATFAAASAVGDAEQPRRQLRDRILASVRPRAQVRFPWWQQAIAASLIAAAAGAAGWYEHRAPAAMLAVVQLPSAPPTSIPKLVAAPKVDAAPEIASLAQQLADANQKLNALAQQTAASDQAVASARAELASAKDETARLRTEREQIGTSTANAESRYQQALLDLRQATERGNSLSRQVALYQAVAGKQSERLTQLAQIANVASSPDLKFFRLRGTTNAPQASANAFAVEGSKLVFVAFDLPETPPGRVYQLWLMRRRGVPILSGGIFTAKRGKQSFIVIDDPASLANLDALAVSEEPTGGSPKPGPTGPKFLIGAAS